MFNDRIDAGRQLAELFADLRDREDVIVLGLPRGGVPVAAEVARAIAAPLDILLVRKLGVPGQEELAMGAIASGDHLIRDDEIIAHMNVSESEIAAAIAREQDVLRHREQRYRGNRLHPDLHGKIVVLIDDGLATGSTMRVAIAAARSQQPAHLLVGIPVGAPDRVAAIRALVDRIECVLAPDGFLAVGQWYRHFSATSDDDVIAALELR